MRNLLLPTIILFVNSALIGLMTVASINDAELPFVAKLLLDLWFFSNAVSFVICWRQLSVRS